MHSIVEKLKNKQTFLKKIYKLRKLRNLKFDRTRGEKNQIFPTFSVKLKIVGTYFYIKKDLKSIQKRFMETGPEKDIKPQTNPNLAQTLYQPKNPLKSKVQFNVHTATDP